MIHLYEADMGLLWGEKWVKRMKEAIYDRKIDPGQYIGLPGRDYSSIMTFEELRFEYTRLKRFPFSYFDNNLAS